MGHRPDMYRLRNPDHLADGMDTAGISCRQLAAAAGCSKETVAALWSGRRDWVNETIARNICRELDADLNELFEPCNRVSWQRTGSAIKPGAGRTPAQPTV